MSISGRDWQTKNIFCFLDLVCKLMFGVSPGSPSRCGTGRWSSGTRVPLQDRCEIARMSIVARAGGVFQPSKLPTDGSFALCTGGLFGLVRNSQTTSMSSSCLAFNHHSVDSLAREPNLPVDGSGDSLAVVQGPRGCSKRSGPVVGRSSHAHRSTGHLWHPSLLGGHPLSRFRGVSLRHLPRDMGLGCLWSSGSTNAGTLRVGSTGL